VALPEQLETQFTDDRRRAAATAERATTSVDAEP
jgi:hypothetical protein